MSSISDSQSIFATDFCKDQVWVVTGGGTGIGKAISTMAAQLGAKLALCGRRKEPLEIASNEIKSKVPTAQIFYQTCDSRIPDQVEEFIKVVLKTYGRIDVLVNNAGGQYVAPAEGVVPKGFDAVVRNNLIGTWNFIYFTGNLAFIPQKSGNIINIIAQIRNGFPGMIHTGAARAGVDNLTKTLGWEWARFNIRTNAIAPGVIDSGALSKYGTEVLLKAKEATPLQKFGTNNDIANMAIFLASNKAAGFITGQTYYVDGGHSISGAGWVLSQMMKPKL